MLYQADVDECTRLVEEAAKEALEEKTVAAVSNCLVSLLAEHSSQQADAKAAPLTATRHHGPERLQRQCLVTAEVQHAHAADGRQPAAESAWPPSVAGERQRRGAGRLAAISAEAISF